MIKLTERQKDVLAIIRKKSMDGLNPTFAELGQELGIGNQAVNDHLNALSRKGFLAKNPRRARAIMLTEKAFNEMDFNLENRGFQQLLDLNFLQSTPSFGGNFQLIVGSSIDLSRRLSDASSVILSLEQKTQNFSSPMAIENSNWTSLTPATKALMAGHPYHLVACNETPYTAFSGYTVVANSKAKILLFNGVASNYYFFRGQEFGSPKEIQIIDATEGQPSLFPEINYGKLNCSKNIMDFFRRKMRSFSQWIDFPLFGGSLSQDLEVNFWSRRTAADTKDLKNLLLLSSGNFTTFASQDQILCRDIAHNFRFVNIII